jgi:hypothetical protein
MNSDIGREMCFVFADCIRRVLCAAQVKEKQNDFVHYVQRVFARGGWMYMCCVQNMFYVYGEYSLNEIDALYRLRAAATAAA